MGNNNTNTNSLSPQEAKKLIKDNTFGIILDVRTENEWNNGHHPNATHIPLDKVEKKFNKLFPDKSIKVLIYCRSGNRAGYAAKILNSQEYSNVYIVSDGGYSDII